MAHRYMTAVETETNRPFNETKGRTTNPYLNNTSNLNNNNAVHTNDEPARTPDRPFKNNYQKTENQPSNNSNTNVWSDDQPNRNPSNDNRPVKNIDQQIKQNNNTEPYKESEGENRPVRTYQKNNPSNMQNNEATQPENNQPL